MSGGWDGRPENPERDGWHWLKEPDPFKEPTCGWWCANDPGNKYKNECWDVAGCDRDLSEMTDPNYPWEYIGPCRTPAEVAAQVAAEVMAEREACAAICGEVAKERWAAEKKHPVGELLFLWSGGPDSECGRRIQQRPAPAGAGAGADALRAQAREAKP